jgi:hypothetical protein
MGNSRRFFADTIPRRSSSSLAGATHVMCGCPAKRERQHRPPATSAGGQAPATLDQWIQKTGRFVLIGFFGSSKKRVVEIKITVNSKNRDSKLKKSGLVYHRILMNLKTK